MLYKEAGSGEVVVLFETVALLKIFPFLTAFPNILVKILFRYSLFAGN